MCLFLNVLENLGSILSWWHNKWHNSMPPHRPLKRRRRRKWKSKTKRNLRKIRKLVLVSPRKIPTKKQSKFPANSAHYILFCGWILSCVLNAFLCSHLRPKSDILKDPPSEANSIQSANATTKTSETNHTSRYLKLEWNTALMLIYLVLRSRGRFCACGFAGWERCWGQGVC